MSDDTVRVALEAPLGVAAICLDNMLAVLPVLIDTCLSIVIMMVLVLSCMLSLRKIDFLPVPVPCKGCEKVSAASSWAITCMAGTGEGTPTCGALMLDLQVFRKLVELLSNIEEAMRKIRQFFMDAIRYFMRAYFTVKMWIKTFMVKIAMVPPDLMALLKIPEIPDIDLGSCNLALTWVPFTDLGEIDICKALSDGIYAILDGLETAINAIGQAIGTALAIVMEPFRLLMAEINFGLLQFSIDMGDIFSFLSVLNQLVHEINLLLSVALKIDYVQLVTRCCIDYCNVPFVPFWYWVMQCWPALTEALDPFPMVLCFTAYFVAAYCMALYSSLLVGPIMMVSRVIKMLM